MKILVDTSVWIDHFRRGDHRLQTARSNGKVFIHRVVIGEIACDLTRRSGRPR